jgi:hypothetical protein
MRRINIIQLRKDIIGRFELSCPWLKTGMALKTKKDLYSSIDRIIEGHIKAPNRSGAI